MTTSSPVLSHLVQSLRCMPGIGPKSAQRIAFQLLARNREGGRVLGQALLDAMDKIGYCQSCRTFTENPLCSYCSSNRRDASSLCIVESPADQFAIEQTGYQGLYFVLHGHLSPLDGLGPEEIGLPQLRLRLQSANGAITEIIAATNPTLEGEATAHYIAQLAKQFHIPCTRLAHGVPLGGELESIDIGTLSHAFAGRGKITEES